MFCRNYSENKHPPENLDATAISLLSSDWHRAVAMKQISKALPEISSKLLNFYTRRFEPIALKLSKGLASLPDELLALILKFAAYSESSRTSHPAQLSHVSQRFRRLALGDQSLWSTLSLDDNTTEENLELLISRGGNTDLHIVIDYERDTNEVARHKLVSLCSHTASRWQSLSLCGRWEWSDGVSTIYDKLPKLMKRPHLVLPRLHELHLEDNRSEPAWVFPRTNFANIPVWEAPSLRILRCTNNIPPPSFPYTTFTIFELSLNLYPDIFPRQAQKILAFLASKPNISEVIIELVTLEYDDEEEEEEEIVVHVVDCPAMTSFQLRLLEVSYGALSEIYGKVIKPLRMPQLQYFSLSVKPSYGIEELLESDIFPPPFSTLLPDPAHHPLLTSLTFELEIPAFSVTEASLEVRSILLDIPLDKIPHVSFLRLKTFCWVSFSRKPVIRQGEETLSSLRELQLQSCVSMDTEGLQRVVQSLKDAGAWDSLERVVIQGCDLLTCEAALEAVGEERLYFSKS